MNLTKVTAAYILSILGVFTLLILALGHVKKNADKIESHANQFVGKDIIISRDTTTIMYYNEWTGYLKCKDGTLVDPKQIHKFKILESVEGAE